MENALGEDHEKIDFGAYLTYSPRGNREIDRDSRERCYGIKNGNNASIAGCVQTILNKRIIEFEPFFQENTVLVPVPRSNPTKKGAFWPAKAICEEMANQKLAMGIEAVLWRSKQVPKSALAESFNRPEPDDHFQTFECSVIKSELPLEITLVDDVFTRGSTFLGAAKVLKQSFPNAIIRAFALYWTSGRFEKPESMEAPVRGTLKIGRFGKPIRRKQKIQNCDFAETESSATT